MRRLGEGALGGGLVAGFGVDAQIGTVLVPDERCLWRQRVRRPYDGWHRGVLDREAFGSIRRVRQCLGYDESDRFADIAGFAKRQNRVRRDQEWRAVAAFERHLVWVSRHRAVWDRLEPVRCRVAAR